jgi:hypothetical protein
MVQHNPRLEMLYVVDYPLEDLKAHHSFVSGHNPAGMKAEVTPQIADICGFYPYVGRMVFRVWALFHFDSQKVRVGLSLH